jgi:hypothetical protein
MLVVTWWILRYRLVSMRAIESQKSCLLEIKLPKEVLKSPAGMEIFFSYFAQGGAKTLAETYLEGKSRPWFSCELVSIEGEVRFFVWCSQAKFKSVVESQLYAQYPNIEVHEIKDENDYTRNVSYDLEKYIFYACQFKKAKADPYPIRTYIDYGLSDDPKDEFKIDPMTAVLEFLGSMRKGENLWLQILIQKHEPEGWKHGTVLMDTDPKKANIFEKMLMSLLGKSRSLKDEVKKEIEKIREEAIPKPKPGEEISFKFPNPTKGQNEDIAALERNGGKQPFDCTIRGVYAAETKVFDAVNITGMLGCFRQYEGLNNIKLGLNSDVTDFEKEFIAFTPFLWFLKSHQKRVIERMRGDLLHAYKLRSYFQLPYKKYGKGSKPFILSTEELASLFHFPSGLVSQTPTLKRVESKKSGAPANLPI